MVYHSVLADITLLFIFYLYLTIFCLYNYIFIFNIILIFIVKRFRNVFQLLQDAI